MLISFCGLDGSGKTTQVQLLKNVLEKKTKKRIVTLSGYKPQSYMLILKQIRSTMGIKADTLFPAEIVSFALLLDLWKNTKEVIIPEIQRGNIVITERYWDSSLIYAPILAKDKNFMKAIIKSVIPKFPIPDISIYLDILPHTAYTRVKEREEVDVATKDSLELMKIVRKDYFKLMESMHNCLIIDANNDIKSVHEKIVEEVQLRL